MITGDLSQAVGGGGLSNAGFCFFLSLHDLHFVAKTSGCRIGRIGNSKHADYASWSLSVHRVTFCTLFKLSCQAK